MPDTDVLSEEFTGCEICLCAHDEEIHAATLAVHSWMRQEVTKWFMDDDDIPLDDDPIPFVLIESSAA